MKLASSGSSGLSDASIPEGDVGITLNELFSIILMRLDEVNLAGSESLSEVKLKISEETLKQIEMASAAIEKQGEGDRGRKLSRIGEIFSVVFSVVAFIVAPSPLSATALIMSLGLMIDSQVAARVDSYKGALGELSAVVMSRLDSTELSTLARSLVTVLVITCVVLVSSIAVYGGASAASVAVSGVVDDLLLKMSSILANASIEFTVNSSFVSMVLDIGALFSELMSCAGDIDVSVINFKIQEIMNEHSETGALVDFARMIESFLLSMVDESSSATEEINEFLMQLKG